MVKVSICPICKSSDIKYYRKIITLTQPLFSEIVPGVKTEVVPVSHFFECKTCNLIFQNPRLSDKELEKFYSLGIYRKLVDMTDGQMDEDEIQRAKVDSKIIKSYVPNLESHLDVGSSRGHLLNSIGAKVKVGVESNLKYIRLQKTKVFKKVTLLPKKEFDLVTIIHTLEHVPHPIDFLKKIKKFLKKESYLVIEVPTWKSPGGPLRFPHLYHFEPDVLRLICIKVGLKVVNTEFTPHLILICKLNN